MNSPDESPLAYLEHRAMLLLVVAVSLALAWILLPFYGITGSFALMKDQGIVDSGEAVAAGIGAMSQRRIQDFCIQMVKAGL
jgi:hypothetical protein